METGRMAYEQDLLKALAEEKKSRKDDNAALTADNLRLEEENAELRNLLESR